MDDQRPPPAISHSLRSCLQMPAGADQSFLSRCLFLSVSLSCSLYIFLLNFPQLVLKSSIRYSCGVVFPLVLLPPSLRSGGKRRTRGNTYFPHLYRNVLFI